MKFANSTILAVMTDNFQTTMLAARKAIQELDDENKNLKTELSTLKKETGGIVLMEYHVVHVTIYSTFPAKVEVLCGCSTREEAEREIGRIYEESYRDNPDVSYDEDNGRIDYDDGQNGYHSWLIAEQLDYETKESING